MRFAKVQLMPLKMGCALIGRRARKEGIVGRTDKTRSPGAYRGIARGGWRKLGFIRGFPNLSALSEALNVFGLQAFWPLGDVKLYALPFLQGTEAACLNC